MKRTKLWIATLCLLLAFSTLVVPTQVRAELDQGTAPPPPPPSTDLTPEMIALIVSLIHW